MELETIYIEGDSIAFKAFIDSHYKTETVELRGIEGKNRWVIKRDDGTEYIARPLSSALNEGTYKILYSVNPEEWKNVVGSKGTS